MKALTCLPSPSALSPPLKWTRLEGGKDRGRSGVQRGMEEGRRARGDTQDTRMRGSSQVRVKLAGQRSVEIWSSGKVRRCLWS